VAIKKVCYAGEKSGADARISGANRRSRCSPQLSGLIMAGFKTPDFNERAAASRAARQSAVEQLRNKPAPDPEAVAARQAAHAAREERRAAKKAAADEAKAKRAEAASAKAAEAEAARAEAQSAEAAHAEAVAKSQAPERTEAELKAARDARYAARKARQR
jgi:hypothetical protein